VATFSIEETREIAAPVSVVWEVITDLSRYPEWNPFVVACRSTLEEGAPIDMRVALIGCVAQPQREVVFAHEPTTRLCYGLDGGALRAIVSRRCHHLAPIDPHRTSYTSRFELSGWLMPVVRGLLGARLRAGFGAMTAALHDRAESVNAPRTPSP